MNRILLSALLALLLFSSCVSETDRRSPSSSQIPGAWETPWPYIIIDYKNKVTGGSIPEWVSLWLEGGDREVETLGVYQNRNVFISRNEGNNFNALTQWAEWFNAELDFPRLAAARIEARFLSGVSHPDTAYGAFFVALIRAASDALWAGAIREDDFWIRRKLFPIGDVLPASIDLDNIDPLPDEEKWEFFILVTIEKSLFTSQLDAIFDTIVPSPQPTREQVNAVNRVIDRFYHGF